MVSLGNTFVKKDNEKKKNLVNSEKNMLKKFKCSNYLNFNFLHVATCITVASPRQSGNVNF